MSRRVRIEISIVHALIMSILVSSLCFSVQWAAHKFIIEHNGVESVLLLNRKSSRLWTSSVYCSHLDATE